VTRLDAVALAATLLASSGCTSSQIVDFAMGSAKRPASHRALRVGDRQVLAGDMHCHVLPPDAPWHVTRGLDATIDLATEQDLDFVVLTPHVPARFYSSRSYRAWVLRTQRELRERLAEKTARLGEGAPLFVPGFEYTDYEYGHVGAAFADVEKVLDALSAEDAYHEPDAFFRLWIEQGGLLTINHPVERPLHGAPFSMLRADLSWRGFAEGANVPPEIAFISSHAQTVETFNASITHLRDQFILGDEERSLREAAWLVDRVARDEGRRVAHVGGSDSHGYWLRPSTYVLARGRSIAAVRDALVGARTCVRGPEACTLEVRAPEGEWQAVGGAVEAQAGLVEARAQGPAAFFANGVLAARSARGEAVTIPVASGRCTLVRAVVGLSWSSPVYVGCRLR
jgi:hypothetical protein